MKNIYVRRYGFPARIQIIIRERTPIAIIKTDLKKVNQQHFSPQTEYLLLTNNT